jgi:hypothetical protein
MLVDFKTGNGDLKSKKNKTLETSVLKVVALKSYKPTQYKPYHTMHKMWGKKNTLQALCMYSNVFFAFLLS